MLYLIDGYNLIFRLPLKKSSLQHKRESVAKELNSLIAELGIRASIVFDAPRGQQHDSIRSHIDALEVVYTSAGESADDYILQEVLLSKRPRQITVVTSDRSLATQCKAQGANIKSIEEFLSWIAEKRRKKRKKQKELSAGSAFQDSDANLSRLLAIFEKRLSEGS